MKIVEKVICAITAVFVAMLVFGVESHAMNVSEMKDLWHVTKEYPISGEKESFVKYGYEGVIDILNPPSDVLTNMTSEELANLMMDYPLMWVILSYEFDQADLFFDYLERNCDVYKELLRRDDGIRCILERYRNSDFNPGACFDDPNVLFNHNKEFSAEVFGCQFIKLMGKKISGKDMALVKKTMKEKSELYGKVVNSVAGRYLSFEKNLVLSGQIEWSRWISDGEIMSYSNGFSATGGPNVNKWILVKYITFMPGSFHKYDVRVSCLKHVSGAYTSSEISGFKRSIAYAWTSIGEPSPKYNCHSYAWIQSNTSNPFWLDSPIGYINSPSVDYIGSDIIPQTGDIIVIKKSTGEITHSGIVSSYSYGVLYIKSKIGGKGLYISPMNELLNYYGSSYDVYRTR